MNRAVMKKTMYFFVLPALIFYLLFWIIPILKLFQYSVTDYNGYVQSFNYIGFDNFKTLAHEEILGVSIKNTLLYTFISVILGNIIALALAFLLNANIRAKGLYRSAFYIPTLFSAIVVGFIWSYIYMPDEGLIASLLNKLGITGIDTNFLGSYDKSLYSIIAVDIWKNIGTSTIIFLAGLQTVPHDLIEAGKIDGAGRWNLVRYIKIPLLATSVTINVTLSVINGLKAFDYSYIMTNGGPGTSTNTLIFAIYKMAFTEQLFGKASALGIISFAIIIVITAAFVLTLNRKEVSA
ncbi:carbohydrate ABC transporter permease [Cohnella thailandensis]|jgi:ABC-type sugar transport systems, permease components|uniref:Sugar ABC transporter permease n=1 Tax=Cohnella thailandensis TaxID=557557 RepID=A0A841SX06_9BACL|nr:sugar ABC transporter permease [Cohnella thailandensis]MBB6634708.1 sugar ABC transporter permease [Cohnella thailandensis]MBP1972736.1 ABC-type sugar transport system permease subunit [Cohnella thailandensis]